MDLFERSMQLDYFGSLFLAKSVLPGMVGRKTGQLLFIASPLAAIGEIVSEMYLQAELVAMTSNMVIDYSFQFSRPDMKWLQFQRQ